MTTVILTAAQWRHYQPDGHTTHIKGDRIDLDDETATWLLDTGAAVDASTVTDLESEEVEPEVAEEASDTSDEEPDPVERPLKTARLEVWQDYARKMRVDPRDRTKAELIALTTN